MSTEANLNGNEIAMRGSEQATIEQVHHDRGSDKVDLNLFPKFDDMSPYLGFGSGYVLVCNRGNYRYYFSIKYRCSTRHQDSLAWISTSYLLTSTVA
ncbi:hypothetical protein WG66_009790 [Moniliophthora roreri]|uniref:Uncharacterized protein n=1 Tax=Moniliophthora roreri TaxID=221103 RepID=A0A0W0GDH1_MONRR|nr:hypothetical protein WG66_009790 [Moniliophthora roreri]